MPTLNWIGKDRVAAHVKDVPFRMLSHQYGFRADDKQNTAPTGSGNRIIHGDNLEALKALLPELEGRVDCIYIDPPYNTGEEHWVYNDNVNDPQLRKWLGEVVGPEGEDLTRHDKWLCMMYPRLVLLKQMLSSRGAIFISIDSNEHENLLALCNEIFGKQCLVADFVWQKAYSARNDSKGVPETSEYIVAYSLQPGWTPNRLERTEEMDAKYKNPDNDFALWRTDNPCAPNAVTHQGMVYAIQHPFTGEMLYPYNGACWRYQQEEMLNIMQGWCEYELRDLDDAERRAAVCNISEAEVREGVMGIVLKRSLEESQAAAQAVYDRGQWPKFFFTRGGKGGISRKTYLTNVEGRLVTTLWPHTEVGHTDGAKKELKRIFGGTTPFETPKPSTLVERIVEIATQDDSIVLDAFAGSGTTGHAVLLQNKKDKGCRKFVLVDCMDYAETITAERMRRVMAGYPFKGKKEEEIYSKKLTLANLPKAVKWLEEAKAAAEAAASQYEKVSKPKVADNCLKVIGTHVYEDVMPGLGGSFDYYELGEPLFREDGMLNEAVGEDTVRRYVYHSETRQPLTRQRSEAEPYLMDTFAHTAYYFYYEPAAPTTLDRQTLSQVVRTRAEQYIIYADRCLLEETFMKAHNIRFKKIPRDIKKL